MNTGVYKDFKRPESKSGAPTYIGGAELKRGMDHVMIDMETLCERNDAVILSLGAVYFNPNNSEMGPEFYANVDPRSCQELGMSIGIGTIDWWMKQGVEIYKLTRSNPTPAPIDMVLLQFQAWIDLNRKYPELWSNGDSFDNSILENACHLTKVPYPTKFYNRRDVRTLVALGKHAGLNHKQSEFKKGITLHHALDDAKYQVLYTSYLWQHLIGGKS